MPSALTSSGCLSGGLPGYSACVYCYKADNIRQVDMDDGLRIWRNFQMGNLFDLIMIDTRHYDRSITDISTAYS
jgi:phosphodiesterase/alkaline phosphatase D-like protein